jgi:hypothetical protein
MLSQHMSKLYRLVNCLEHDIYINTHAGLVSLPQLARPELLHAPGESEKLSLGVPGDKHLSSEVDYYNGIIVFGANNVPPVLDGIIYIVPLSTLFQFPDREDFVIANLWEVGSFNYSEGSEHSEMVHILNGVTRSPFNITSVKGIEEITNTAFFDEIDEAEDADENKDEY